MMKKTDLSYPLEINSKEDYMELRNAFDTIFMGMEIVEPGIYLENYEKILNHIFHEPYVIKIS